MDSDHDGLVTASDASVVVRKYRKSLPESVVEGLEESLDKLVIQIGRTREYPTSRFEIILS